MSAVSVFSNSLRKLLEEKDKTQKDLADYVGVSPASVNFWFNGKKIPKIDKIKKIASFFHVDVSELLSDPDSPPPAKPVKVDKVPDTAKPANDLMLELFADRPEVLNLLNNNIYRDNDNLPRPLSPELKLHIKNSILFTLRANGYNV